MLLHREDGASRSSSQVAGNFLINREVAEWFTGGKPLDLGVVVAFVTILMKGTAAVKTANLVPERKSIFFFIYKL